VFGLLRRSSTESGKGGLLHSEDADFQMAYNCVMFFRLSSSQRNWRMSKVLTIKIKMTENVATQSDDEAR
jgi:hypothetical protein